LQYVKTAYVGLVHSSVKFNQYHAQSKSTLTFFNKIKKVQLHLCGLLV